MTGDERRVEPTPQEAAEAAKACLLHAMRVIGVQNRVVGTRVRPNVVGVPVVDFGAMDPPTTQRVAAALTHAEALVEQARREQGYQPLADARRATSGWFDPAGPPTGTAA